MNLKNKRKNIFITLAILIIVTILSFIGWNIWNASNNSSIISDSTFSVDIDPMVGGGEMGAVDSYQINSSGKVYNFKSPDYKSTITKTLIRTISSQEVNELRNSFIESGVMEISSGEGPKYGGSMWTVTINGNKKIFYDLSSSKFDNLKLILKNIIGSNILINYQFRKQY